MFALWFPNFTRNSAAQRQVFTFLFWHRNALFHTSRHPLAERAILAECFAGRICIIVLKVIGVSELI